MRLTRREILREIKFLETKERKRISSDELSRENLLYNRFVSLIRINVLARQKTTKKIPENCCRREDEAGGGMSN